MVGSCQTADNPNRCVCCITQRKIAQVVKTNNIITVDRGCCKRSKLICIDYKTIGFTDVNMVHFPC